MQFEMPGPLTKDDVKCLVCLSIMIEPVSFPCKHSLCYECFTTHMRETSINCHVCRQRVGTWARVATKENRLINRHFWKQIQEQVNF